MAGLSEMNDFLLMVVLENLNVYSLTNVATTSKRLFVLVYSILNNSPKFLTIKTGEDTKDSINPEVMLSALEKFQSIPSFCICFATSVAKKKMESLTSAFLKLPLSTHVILASCRDVEDISNGASTGSAMQCGSSMIIGAFPRSICSSFMILASQIGRATSTCFSDEILTAAGMVDVNEVE